MEREGKGREREFRGANAFIPSGDTTQYKCFIPGISPVQLCSPHLYRPVCIGSIPGTNEVEAHRNDHLSGTNEVETRYKWSRSHADVGNSVADCTSSIWGRHKTE
jgi:hypothetical protein